jgi:hypothetical protein
MKKISFLLGVSKRIKKTLFYLLLLLLMTNVSCKKKKCESTIPACAAFSDPFFDTWFPYSLRQEVVFLSAAGREKKLSIELDYKSVERMGSTYEYDCNSYSTATLAPNSQQCPNAMISSTQPTNNTVGFRVAYSPSRELMLYIDTTILYAISLQDTGIVNLQSMGRSRSNSSKFYPSYVANGTSYNKVQVITRDTISDRTSGIYRIVLAQTLGLIEYEEYPSLTLWRKQ